MRASTAVSEPEWYLRNITRREPLYKEAAFSLAFLYLQEGNIAAARTYFQQLTEPYDKERERRLVELKEKWAQQGVRHWWLLKFKPYARLVVPWVEHWRQIFYLLGGGALYRDARRWEEFDEQYATFKKASTGDAFARQMFELYLRGFWDASVRAEVRIVAGLEKGDAEAARWALTKLLSTQEIERVHSKLGLLQGNLVLAEVLAANEEPVKTPDITAISQSAVLNRDELKELVERWEAHDWKRCESLLNDLLSFTQTPSDYLARQQIKEGMPEKTIEEQGRYGAWRRRLGERLATRFHIPDLRAIEDWQKSLEGFYVESEYYLALCEFRAFTNEGIGAALERAMELNDRLQRAVPRGASRRRYAELRLLLDCLEADSALRTILQNNSNNPHNVTASIRWRKSGPRTSRTVRRASRKSAYSDEIRATLHRTLALIARYGRKSIMAEEKSDLDAELAAYAASLRAKVTPDTCFCLAETYLETTRPEEIYQQPARAAEAARYLDEAIRLCPRHAGAIALQRSLAQRMEKK